MSWVSQATNWVSDRIIPNEVSQVFTTAANVVKETVVGAVMAPINLAVGVATGNWGGFFGQVAQAPITTMLTGAEPAGVTGKLLSNWFGGAKSEQTNLTAKANDVTPQDTTYTARGASTTQGAVRGNRSPYVDRNPRRETILYNPTAADTSLSRSGSLGSAADAYGRERGTLLGS